MPIETRRVCVLSMAHLREETVLDLYARPAADWPCLGNRVGEDMILAHVASENAGVGTDEIPDDLWACMVWAGVDEWGRGLGFDYIMFDRDVDPAEDGSGLPDYSEPEAGA